MGFLEMKIFSKRKFYFKVQNFISKYKSARAAVHILFINSKILKMGPASAWASLNMNEI